MFITVIKIYEPSMLLTWGEMMEMSEKKKFFNYQTINFVSSLTPLLCLSSSSLTHRFPCWLWPWEDFNATKCVGLLDINDDLLHTTKEQTTWNLLPIVVCVIKARQFERKISHDARSRKSIIFYNNAIVHLSMRQQQCHEVKYVLSFNLCLTSSIIHIQI
jgi:hypothetical protein